MKYLIFVCLALGVTGCVTLGGDPVMQSMQTVQVSAPCAPVGEASLTVPRPSLGATVEVERDGHRIVRNATQAEQNLSQDYRAAHTGDNEDMSALCGSLRRSVATGESYIEFGRQLDSAQAGLGLTQLGAVAALAGFNVFDAHEDNIAAATLLAAIATGARAGLHPAARRDIMRRGASGMMCLATEGGDFLPSVNHIAALQTAANAAAGIALSADLRRNQLHGKADAEEAALAAAIATLDASVAAASDAIGYRRTAAARVSASHRAIENRLSELLAAQVPDFDAVAKVIHDSNGEPAPVAPEQPAEGNMLAQSDVELLLQSRSRQQIRALAAPDAAEELRQLTIVVTRVNTALVSQTRGPGQSELDEIAACVNLN